MKNFFILFFLLIFLSCSQNSEWISLFDGKNIKGLRGYKMENFPWDSWVIKNATLKTIPGKHGVDLISEGIFEDFELDFGSDSFIPGVEYQVIGINPKEDRTIEVKFPETYQHKEMAGKDFSFVKKQL